MNSIISMPCTYFYWFLKLVPARYFENMTTKRRGLQLSLTKQCSYINWSSPAEVSQTIHLH